MSRLLLLGASAPALAARPPAHYDSCSGPIQPHLRYGLSGRTEPEVPFARVEANETLADAVCCDVRAAAFAEPQNLYLAPDIRLFTHLSRFDVTTFYDSLCGLPLFRAPVGRTFDEWQGETGVHGWPSFREAERIGNHVRVNKTSGFVTSTCGTHLGTYLMDDDGPRYCLDLACISGEPVRAVREEV